MGIKATVTPLVIVGTDRGGENLYLVFTAQEDPTLQGIELTLDDGDIDWIDDEDDDTQENEDTEENDDTLYRIKTEHHEFEWLGSVNDLKKLFQEIGGHNMFNWTWCGSVASPPMKQFKHTHFVSGNAE